MTGSMIVRAWMAAVFRALFLVEGMVKMNKRDTKPHGADNPLRSKTERRVKERRSDLIRANDLLQQEVAEHRKTEAALQRERDKIQEYLDVAGVMLIVIDNGQKLRLINRKGYDILKCREPDALGRDWCETFVPDHSRDGVRQVISGLLQGQVERYEYYENPVVSTDGKERLIAWHNAVLRDGEGRIEAVLSSGQDVTAQKRAEEAARRAYDELEAAHRELGETQYQLVQSEKLACIGQIAAGVAHEISNPVGFVMTNFQALHTYVDQFRTLFAAYDELVAGAATLEKGELVARAAAISQMRQEMEIDFVLEDVKELLADSKEGLDRVTRIIRDLKDFSRSGQAEDYGEHNLNEGIETSLAVAGNEIKYDAEVSTDFSEIPLVWCNSGQIKQVILNIVVNAAQAIRSQERGGKGAITIRTYAAGDEVVCEISDDGPGIEPDNLKRIFDPFYTTKPVGQGTGLGLSVSYDIIVNKHHGALFARSTPAKGTTFVIKIPINVNQPLPRAAATPVFTHAS